MSYSEATVTYQKVTQIALRRYVTVEAKVNGTGKAPTDIQMVTPDSNYNRQYVLSGGRYTTVPGRLFQTVTDSGSCQ